MSLSSYWAKGHHRSLSATTDEAARLAIALGAVRSIVRVVDRTDPPLDVDWAQVDEKGGKSRSMSYTDMENGHIRINPLPILDEALESGQALDISIGFGLHEASHSQESRSRYTDLLRREKVSGSNADGSDAYRLYPAFEPARVAAYLWNLVEDVRIEIATANHWPGFKPYFSRVLDYMWGELRRNHDLPTEYSAKIEDRLRVVFLACRYPDRIAGVRAADVALASELDWWQAWQADYLSGATDTKETIQRGLDHLAEDTDTASEMEKMATAERDERLRGELVKAQLDRLIREGIDGAFEVCAMDEADLVPLDRDLAEAVKQLVRENLVEHKTIVTAEGNANPPIRVSKPTETAASRKAYVGRPDAMTEALRAALVFRPAAPQHDAKLLKAGQIDDEELYRIATGDMRVFSERVLETKPDVFMGLLVDLSGSMSGRKLEIAQRLAQLFVWAVHDQEGIATSVWGHTADIGTEPTADVFRLWEQGDPLARLGLIQSLLHANNADGHAIAYVASQIMLVEQPEKVLVVLSDGLPQAHGYGRSAAQRHVRSVTRWAAKRGVRVIQIAIDPDGISPEDQSAMFGTDWLPFTGYASLPRQLATLMGRYV